MKPWLGTEGLDRYQEAEEAGESGTCKVGTEKSGRGMQDRDAGLVTCGEGQLCAQTGRLVSTQNQTHPTEKPEHAPQGS